MTFTSSKQNQSGPDHFEEAQSVHASQSDRIPRSKPENSDSEKDKEKVFSHQLSFGDEYLHPSDRLGMAESSPVGYI